MGLVGGGSCGISLISNGASPNGNSVAVLYSSEVPSVPALSLLVLQVSSIEEMLLVELYLLSRRGGEIMGMFISVSLFSHRIQSFHSSMSRGWSVGLLP